MPLKQPVLRAQAGPFQQLLASIRGNSTEFQAEGRILRLKNHMRADAQPAEIDAVIDALAQNTRVEALYIQNFEEVRSAQLLRPLAGCSFRRFLPCLPARPFWALPRTGIDCIYAAGSAQQQQQARVPPASTACQSIALPPSPTCRPSPGCCVPAGWQRPLTRVCLLRSFRVNVV